MADLKVGLISNNRPDSRPTNKKLRTPQSGHQPCYGFQSCTVKIQSSCLTALSCILKLWKHTERTFHALVLTTVDTLTGCPFTYHIPVLSPSSLFHVTRFIYWCVEAE
jgi:hypothetical protein